VGDPYSAAAAMRNEGVITVKQQDGVLHAVMRNPPTNALSLPLVAALRGLVDEFERGSAKVLLLSSDVPGFFAAGAELNHTSGLTAEDLADYRDAFCEALESLAGCLRPSIAAIDGLALGGGLELAMACTLRCCSRTARLGLPEVQLGLVPGGGATQRLPRLIGRGRALELMLSGREIDGAEAWRIGLADRLLYRDVVGEARKIAVALAGSSGPAMAAIMSCVDAARDLPHQDGMAVERVALLSTFEDGEAREGIDAFVQKRRPMFG
jgi:enoyl-CoA hydratase/carnithine racemase